MTNTDYRPQGPRKNARNSQNSGNSSNFKGSRKSRNSRHSRKRFLRKFLITCIFSASALLCMLLLCGILLEITLAEMSSGFFSHAPKTSPILTGSPTADRTPASDADVEKTLVDLLDRNPETYDFVTKYADRETYLNTPVDLSADEELLALLAAGEVPLLMQWDLRWGYAPYGNDMIGLSGCGPVCLSMAYIFLTRDASMDPAAMADFAATHGFCTQYGTDWALWTDGAKLLGLDGEVLTLSEPAMQRTLDNGGLIVCSMRPGDFTTTGHFILIRGYDENGFFVNDPNCLANSEKQWSYLEISPQIKNLWGIRKP